ncbi:hypothetical protein VTO73DRAFT_1660 [Trametes versicolor]
MRPDSYRHSGSRRRARTPWTPSVLCATPDSPKGTPQYLSLSKSAASRTSSPTERSLVRNRAPYSKCPSGLHMLARVPWF